MQKPPIKHNPAFLTDKELADAFVVRGDDLGIIMRVIRENVSDSNQHILVIGPRGIGKTMLVRRIAIEVGQDEELQHKWYPLIFAEESYEVGTVGEFWLESLFHLGRQTGDPKWSRTYDDLKREPVDDRLHERALAQLMDFADSHGKRVILIVENLNMLLGDQITQDHAWKLRHTLMHEPRIMLLGTATTKLDLPENTHRAMFELFKSHVLRPLNDEECQVLWRSVAGQDLGPRRIRAVSILTGGNPRLLAIISHFGARLSFAELMQEMTSLVDDHTDYFKSHLDALPPTERKAYVALSDLWDPSTARQVANASRLGVSLTSSLLRRLVGRGAVIEVSGKGRTKHYQVAERMYNIYYLMRRRGAPSERVKAVVEFMVQFYEETEHVEVTKRLAEEACRLSREDRQYHYHAFEGIVRTATNELRSKILQGTVRDFLEAPDRPESLRRLLMESGVKGVCPCALGRHSDKRIHKLMNVGMNAASKGLKQRAEKAFRRACSIDASYADAWIRLGRILHELPDHTEEAELACRKAIEVESSNPCAWDGLGRLLSSDRNRREEAEEAFRRAVELYADCSHAWLGLADIARRQPGREQDANQASLRADEAALHRTQKYPDDAQGWSMLAHIRHHHTKRYVEAVAAYREAIELDPKNESLWLELGRLFHIRLNRYAEAEAAYRKTLELDPRSVSALGTLAKLLIYPLEKYEEAEILLRKVIEIGLGCAHFAWADLGLLNERLERYSEAESAYRKAIEIDPTFDWAWEHLASLLDEQMKQYPEAELAYQKASDLDPRHLCPWFNMAKLLQKLTNQGADVESTYRKAVEIDSKNVWAWTQLGDLIARRGTSLEEAEQAYRRAIETGPQYTYPKIRLVELLLNELKQPDLALELAQTTLADNPEDTSLLNRMAWDFFESGPVEFLVQAEGWASKMVQLDDDPSCIHTLACVLARAGKATEALAFTRKLANNPGFVGSNVDDMVRLFGELTAAGYAAEAYAVLRESRGATALEPVLVALQMYLGKVVQVAPEIAEVAKDVLQLLKR